MKYDVTIPLYDHRGKPMKISDQSEQHATLRDVLELVCMAGNDQVKTVEDKMKVYRILQRVVVVEKVVELSIEELALLKKIIGAIYPPVLVGSVFDVLEKPLAD